MQPVFQDPNSSLNPDLTVERIIGEGLLLNAPGARADWRQHSAHWLAQVGLSHDLASRRARELSAGEKQRVAIARALSVSPKLLVCDEPVSALDVSARGQVINLLLDLQDRFGLGLLFISHDLQLVRYISHRILVMYAGRVVETASADELHERARHPYTRALLHASRSIRARHSLRVLEGEMVDPARLPSGCAFHPRCPRAEPGRCDKEQPLLLPSDDDPQHLIACHFPCS
jgi:oligopeptide/dipeptide ABC transporter ATP-binding protein